MAEVALQEYYQEIEGLIERSAYDEAIAHARHILGQYPKCVEAYRLMAKAALDREDDQQATDLFARVLSADPADFVSRAGLAIIYERQGSVKDAVWQMERAYELRPGNQAVQDELRKLYARRDGTDPKRVPLTRGALARLYVNGDLYSEAAAELRALLAREPDRPDLQVLLANSLWHDDQRLEAADTALQVLDRMPYCLDANLILGEIWMSGGREDDAEVHLNRAKSLDPEAERARSLFGKFSPIPAGTVMVDRLDYVPPEEVVPEEQLPEWLAGVGEQAEPEAAGAEVPTWLTGWAAGPEGEQAGEKTEEAEEKAAPEPAGIAAEPIPDWLLGMGATTEAGVPEAPTTTPETEESVPDWLSQLGETGKIGEEQPATAGEQVPDWLSQLRAEVGEEAAPGEGEPGAEAGVPDWLAAVAPAETAPSGEEVPDWLAQLRAETGPLSAEAVPPEVGAGPEVVEEETLELEQAGPEEAVPDWMAQLRAKAGPEAEAAPEEAELGEESMPTLMPAEIPDWLETLKPETAQPAVEETAEVEEVAPVEESVPDWLAALHAESQAPSPAEPEVEEELFAAPEPGQVPDWLQALRPEEAEAIAPEPSEIPDWLQELKPKEAAPAPVEPETTPAWMAEGAPPPTPEEAMAFFQKLTAGKETELQAKAQAEADVRMAEITGRKPGTAPLPAPIEQAPVKPVSVAPPEEPTPEPTPAPAEAEAKPAWMEEGAPPPTPEEAMAFFQKLTAGKEAELQAKAQAEADVRMVEITGRKPGTAPLPVPPPVVPRRAPTAQPPARPVVPAPVAPPEEPTPEPTPAPAEAEAQPPWMAEGAPPPTPEEAMAFFQKLAAGKEAELQARAQAEAEARVAEITGRTPAAKPPEARAPEIIERAPSPEVQPAVVEPVVEVPPVVERPIVPEARIEEAEAVSVAQPEVIAEPEKPVVEEVVPAVAETPQVVAAPAAVTLTARAPEKVERQGMAPGVAGPEWWYQTLADEEGPRGEEVVEEAEPEPAVPERVVAVVEAAPPVAAPVPEPVVTAPEPEEVAPQAAVPEAAPAAPPRKPAIPAAPRRLIRQKKAAAPAPPPVDMDAIMARLRENPDDHAALLEMARGAVRLGDFKAARGAYEELVHTGASLEDVISDLDTFVDDHPDQVDYIRLLGDANMKTGNLQKALKLYRQALKKL